jgi:hypothetical protein
LGAWAIHDFIDPTVISVWFEKKKGMDSKVLISSPVFGPKAQILVASLALIDIPAHVLTSQDELRANQDKFRVNQRTQLVNISGPGDGVNRVVIF